MKVSRLAFAAAALLALEGARAEPLRVTVRDSARTLLPNAVVVAVPADRPPPPARPGVEIVDQIDKEFVPYVKVVRAGSSVQFPNKDNVRHHVYSFSPARKFELPLYRGTPSQPVLFETPGVVKLGCNIHDWMIGYVYVAESPYFGKTRKEGVVELDLPPGRYRVRIWHPRMSDSEADTIRELQVAAGATGAAEWSVRLSPEYRPPRVNVPGDSGYR
jgi:plastocyanin